jgi:hypothetical protein
VEVVKATLEDELTECRAERWSDRGRTHRAFRWGRSGRLSSGFHIVSDRMRHWYRRRVQGIRPSIQCYSFAKADFEAFRREQGLLMQFRDVHPLNPYVGLRFSVVFRNPVS